MNIDINGNQEDISAMMIGAERYALGRRTYIIDYGDECDEACWKALLNKLRGDE